MILLPQEDKEFQLFQPHGVLGNVYRSKSRIKEATTIWRRPQYLDPLSTGTIGPVGLITPWRFCTSMQADSTVRVSAPNKPDHRQSITRTIWVVRWRRRLGFGVDNICSTTSEALRSKRTYEQLGATKDVWRCRALPRLIEKGKKRQTAKSRSTQIPAVGSLNTVATPLATPASCPLAF